MQPVRICGVNSVKNKHIGEHRKDRFCIRISEEAPALKPLFLIFIFSFGLFPSLASADTISCSGGIVSTSDSVVDLLIKCGQPDWKETHQEEFTDLSDPNLKHRTYVTVEQWTYDLGPQQLLRIVTIRNSVVTAIRTGREYGRPTDKAPPGPQCEDRIISIGDTKNEVVAKCGDPFYRTVHNEELWEPLGSNSSRKVVVNVEEWTYNFGPQRFMRIITFRNGRVVDVRTGDYGR